MAQFFRGNLAGLMIRSGKLENKKVIDCLYTCKEGLDVQLPEEVASAVKVRRGQQISQPQQINIFHVVSIVLEHQTLSWCPPFRWSSTPASRL